MKIVLISLALIATVNANVFDTNGMSKIGDIIQDIEDIKSASEDLDIMEARLAGLGAQMGLISSVKSSMTQAMDKTALTFTGEHPNEENGYIFVDDVYCSGSSGAGPDDGDAGFSSSRYGATYDSSDEAISACAETEGCDCVFDQGCDGGYYGFNGGTRTSYTSGGSCAWIRP